MVDYNIAIPQQQLFQAPDFTQNAMRMQQAQLQEMQMQELARKSAAARNTQQLYAQPGFDQFSPEGIRQLGQVGGYKAGIAAATGARQIENLQRQTKATEVGLAQTYQTMGEAAYTNAQNRLAAIPPGDAQSYAGWLDVHGPAYRANGVNLPTPEQWAQDPTGKLQGHMVSTSQSVRERAARAPVYRDFGGTTLRVDSDNPDVLIEPSIRRAGASQQGAGIGPAMVPMSPSKVAEMQATQARVGETVTPFSAAGANAAVNNMPGVPVPDAGAKNAMRAGPLGVQSPYGAPIGAGQFAQQQQMIADERALTLDMAKKRGESQVGQEQALPRAQAEERAKREVGFEKATTGVQMALQSLDEQIRLVTELRNHPGLSKITGTISGAIGTLGQEGVDAQALLDTIKEKGKLTAIVDLKDAGGTLGPVSNVEGEGLKQSIAPLGQRQKTETFQGRADNYLAQLNASKDRLIGAYDATYAYKGAKAPPSNYTVTDPTGKVHTFLSQKTADQFKQAAGL